MKQAKFTHSPFGKTFEKQIRTIQDQGIKQVEALKALNPKVQFIKNEIDEIKKWEEKIRQKKISNKKTNK